MNNDLVNKIMKIFSIRANDTVKSILEWFNKKYDKNLTIDDLELFIDEDDTVRSFYVAEVDYPDLKNKTNSIVTMFKL
jgi:hypothetical protein